MLKVTLQPINDSVTILNGSLLLPALLEKKLNIAMSCGGNGICSTCHVRIRQGMDQLSVMGAKERRTLSMVADSDETSRLACQTHVNGDGVVLELPRGMSIEKVDDLLGLLGSRAPDNILHPIRGHVLIPQGKIITRTLLEQSRSLDEEVQKMKAGLLGREVKPAAVAAVGDSHSFAATGRGKAPSPSSITPPPAKPLEIPTPSTDSIPPGGFSTTRSKLSTLASIPAVTRPLPAPAPRSGPLQQGAPSRSSSGSSENPPRSDSSEAPSTAARGSSASKSVANTDRIVVSESDVVSVSLAARKAQSGVQAKPKPSPATQAPSTGMRIGKFLLVECVGRGGLGVVYRAMHTTLNIPVAVKFLHNQSSGTDAVEPEFLDRFRAEARLLAQLNHPNVVRILDFEDDPAMPYVVMEFIEGLSIQDLLAQTGRIWSERAIALLLQAVDGLEAASRLGIIHRDVKPANILVARDGTAKVVDLGLAVRIDTNATSPSGNHAKSQVDGTVAYLCPARARNPSAFDLRSDIYSLGITFFQMLTGQMPFAGGNLFKMLAAHANDPIPPVHEIAKDVSPAVTNVIARMAAKRVEDRYQSYEEVRKALLALKDRPVAATTR